MFDDDKRGFQHKLDDETRHLLNECLKHIIELNNEHAEAMKVMHIAQTAANEASKDLKNAQNRVVKLTQERTAWLSEMFKDEG